MNITRVERDGVEFFTIDETGESGMSESGLGRLCGVTASSVHRFVSNSAVRWDHEKTLDPRFRKTINLCATNRENLSSIQKTNPKILSATELIEIKTVDRWKDAVGHILAKAHRYPNHAKRLHLFSSEEPILETIEQVCTPHNIRVT